MNEILVIKFIRIFSFILCTTYIELRIVDNIKKLNKSKVIVLTAYCIINAVVYIVIKEISNLTYSIIILILILSMEQFFICEKKIQKNIILTIISLAINCVFFIISTSIAYLICRLAKINNEMISVVIISLINIAIALLLFKINRLKHGIIFLKNKLSNEYFITNIFNISTIIIIFFVTFPNLETMKAGNIVTEMFILAIILFVTIQRSLQMSYKQKQLIQTLEETQKELKQKKNEIEKLEKANLEFSKKSHSLAHKQRALEYKLNKLINKNNSEENIKLKKEIEDVSKELYVKPTRVELSKTDIPEIDNMLEYMQSECEDNDIEFELQIIGNIHYMINNIITKEELEVLLADHIKDAIIAINYSKNINKSILVKIGKIDEYYGIDVFDSGIEFDKETLNKLGKEPVTTHADNGGTGMGFMNTFDTLHKYEASLIIEQIGKPSVENYTKILKIRFDRKNRFDK